jgi:hypothetical protein
MESQPSFSNAENSIGQNARSRRLTGEQQAAIRLAAEIGDDLRKNCPELAEEYRRGATAPMLVATYGFDRRYGVNRRAAIGAVRNAIRGYSGHCYESYPGLIADRSERESLALDHNRRTGMDVYERRVGIHGFTHEQKLDACRKGGLVRGPLSYQLGIGCHALPPEVVREQLRRVASLGGKAGGVASVLAQGMVPYVPAEPGRIAELEFACRLATEPRYRGPVRANFGKIADKVNEMFHAGMPHYTRITMKVALQRHRRRERSGAVYPSDPEMSFTEGLAREPSYQFLARIKAEEIAREVNAQYHGGQPVRNAVSIRAAIRRYLRQTRTFPGVSKPNGQPHVDRPALAREWPDLAGPTTSHEIVEVHAAQREGVILVQ